MKNLSQSSQMFLYECLPSCNEKKGVYRSHVTEMKGEGTQISHSLVSVVCFSSFSHMTAFSSQALLAVKALRRTSHIWLYPRYIYGSQYIHATVFFLYYDFYHLSGQPVPVFHHPHGKKFLHYIQFKPTLP